MIKIAVVGTGNVGRFAITNALAEEDVELVGVITRKKHDLGIAGTENIQIAEDITALDVKPDVAVLCIPTRAVPETAEKCLNAGISTCLLYTSTGL